MVLIDQTAAERFWPHEDPVGSRYASSLALIFGRPKPCCAKIVGVVGRSRSDGLDAPYTPHLFLPARQIQ